MEKLNKIDSVYFTCPFNKKSHFSLVMVLIIFFILLVLFGLAFKEIKKVGLKNILLEVWEGEELCSHYLAYKTEK